jgi:hypothetical protein
VTTELAALSANIAESNQFWDRETGRFFMRLAFTAPETVSRDAIERALKSPIERFSMKTNLVEESRRKRIVIMVSKFDHTLRHLLYQIQVGWLDAEVAAIISNHDTTRKLAEAEGIPFHLLPVTRDTKVAQEEQVLALVKSSGADLVVLARYMQVLSNEACGRLPGRVVNIHHSFLPSFKGREALPPGLRARREARRRHRPLRHRGPRRGPDHRPGRRPGGPHLRRRGDGGTGPRRRIPGARPRPEQADRAAGVPERPPHGGVWVGPFHHHQGVTPAKAGVHPETNERSGGV